MGRFHLRHRNAINHGSLVHLARNTMEKPAGRRSGIRHAEQRRMGQQLRARRIRAPLRFSA